MKSAPRLLGLIGVAGFLLASCRAAPSTIPERRLTALPSIAPSTAASIFTKTTHPTAAPTITSSPLPPTPVPTAIFSICSPLKGYVLNQMPSLVSNPYHPPPPGSDDPHQAVDLADREPGSQIALAGRAVQAVLDGRVAAVVQNRFPYGNALLVETPLENLPDDLPAALGLTDPAPTPVPNLVLTCPDVSPKDWGDGQSLYLLYAHLQQAPAFQPGDPVTCGEGIGLVGATGNALNPHLHLEVRLGPAGVRFQSMAHYDNSATLEEMDNYCTWRVRGVFRLVDPLRLLGYMQP